MKGVVGRFITASIEPIGHSSDDACDNHCRDDEHLPPPAHAVEPRLRFAAFADRGLDVVSGRSVQAVFGVGALIHVRTNVRRARRVRPAFPPVARLKVASCLCFTR
jgi:hypothetical protein